MFPEIDQMNLPKINSAGRHWSRVSERPGAVRSDRAGPANDDKSPFAESQGHEELPGKRASCFVRENKSII